MMLSEETSAVRPQKQTRFNGAKLVWMLKGSPLTVTGAVIIVLMLLMMIFSPWLATHDPNAIDLTARLLPPSAAHWFGTDEVGRDLFSRVLVGSQQSILAGLVVVAIAGMIGSLLGCLSGVLGGRADVIHHPRHPYTIGLLQCAPEHGVPRQLLPAIPGTVPNLTHLPDGCAFRDRCYAAGAQCENVPALTACGDNNQRCACWYPQQEVISV
ncbi:oligopeptide/dipeptide ABC transporter ATP-binding protein [Escherichia coli]|uniref:oligopeptide/dipeptide ABC transporter ATP-binding protein n=1 Tax=Escherichia coli TaxID=562 RepID=UPI003364A23C